ncbi:MAG: DUF2490 domain-containing protein [Bacteroidia bacterium]
MKAVLLASLFLISTGVSAQTRDDFRFWSSFSYSTKITDKWTVLLDNEARWENNATVLGRYFFEPGIRYKFSDLFRLQLQYRFIRDFDERWWGNRHRVTLDAIFKIKQARWKYLIRSRFQYEVNGYGFIDESLSVPELYNREMMKVNYLVNRYWEPFVSFEARFLFQDDALPGFIGLDRHRLRVGTDYNISNQLKFGGFLSWQQEWNRQTNDRLLILGFEISWNAL